MRCDFQQQGQWMICRCGNRMRYTGPGNYVASCRLSEDYLDPSQHPMLGDWTERQLQRLGITEERYKDFKKALVIFGPEPTCNCQKRKRWLNKVGAYLEGLSG